MSFKDTSLGMLSVLSLTAVVVGGILAGFYQLVYPKIEANRLAEERRAIFSVLQGATDYETMVKTIDTEKGEEEIKIFKGLDGEGRVVGYAFIAEGPGFAAVIKMMVGLNINRETLTGLRVIEQIETPGLGSKIAEEKFEGQFRGLAIKPRIEYVKNKKPEKKNQIQAITGATISSRAVVDAINNRIKIVLKILEDME